SEVRQLRDDNANQARGIDQTHRDLQTLRARLDDADKVNASLREQLLALNERARLAEDALANLADKRLSGHDAMRLDEAEMLLALGAERYTLFHDAAATIAAYRHADQALAEIDDAAFSTVRQTISAEIDALGKSGGADFNAGLARLSELRTQIAALPIARPTATQNDDGDSRWWRIFGQFVRVSRGADTQALLARHAGGLAREIAALDLRDAEAALLARDSARYRSSLAAARSELSGAYDPNDAAVATALASIDALARQDVAPPAPEILGASLKELRNLRATHALRAAPRPDANAS
ncbi:MAG TPA: uroporphyrinogen-III C-methyltransferase, partial [Rudaea sp.]